MDRLILALLSVLMVSCASSLPFFGGWGEWVGSDAVNVENNLTATFDWSTHPGAITTIDGSSVGNGFKKAKLSPGRHVIEYVSYPAEFGVHPKGIIEIDLTAGHSYEFCLKLCYWCKPRKFAVWVDDKTTNQKVWGKRPDWPAWYL
jgi:hypothetical protein